jgi:hypothetical protein
MDSNKPTTLRDVGELVARSADYTCAMKEFIDHVIACVLAEPPAAGEPLAVPADLYWDEPPRLEDAIQRAHLAGMAEHLATLSEAPPPEWVEGAAYFLGDPVVFGGERSRQLVMDETPPAFARRNLFCGPALTKLHGLLERGYSPRRP